MGEATQNLSQCLCSFFETVGCDPKFWVTGNFQSQEIWSPVTQIFQVRRRRRRREVIICECAWSHLVSGLGVLDLYLGGEQVTFTSDLLTIFYSNPPMFMILLLTSAQQQSLIQTQFVMNHKQYPECALSPITSTSIHPCACDGCITKLMPNSCLNVPSSIKTQAALPRLA